MTMGIWHDDAAPTCGDDCNCKDCATMAPITSDAPLRVVCPGTAHPPLDAAEVEGMLEYGKIRREVPATSLTAEELEARCAALDIDADVEPIPDDHKGSQKYFGEMDLLAALWLVRRGWSVSEPK